MSLTLAGASEGRFTEEVRGSLSAVNFPTEVFADSHSLTALDVCVAVEALSYYGSD